MMRRPQTCENLGEQGSVKKKQQGAKTPRRGQACFARGRVRRKPVRLEFGEESHRAFRISFEDLWAAIGGSHAGE